MSDHRSFQPALAKEVPHREEQDHFHEREQKVFLQMMQGALATALLARRQTFTADKGPMTVKPFTRSQLTKAEAIAGELVQAPQFTEMCARASEVVKEEVKAVLQRDAAALKRAWSEKILTGSSTIAPFTVNNELDYITAEEGATRKSIYVYAPQVTGDNLPPTDTDSESIASWLKRNPQYTRKANAWIQPGAETRYQKSDLTYVSPEPFGTLPGMMESVTNQALIANVDALVEAMIALQQKHETHTPDVKTFAQLFKEFTVNCRKSAAQILKIHLYVFTEPPAGSGSSGPITWLFGNKYGPRDSDFSLVSYERQETLLALPPRKGTRWTDIGAAKFQGMRDSSIEVLYGVTSEGVEHSETESLRYSADVQVQEAYRLGKEEGLAAASAWKQYVDETIEDTVRGAAETRETLRQNALTVLQQRITQAEGERTAALLKDQQDRERARRLVEKKEELAHLLWQEKGELTLKKEAFAVERARADQEKEVLLSQEREFEGLVLAYQLFEEIDLSVEGERTPEQDELWQELKEKYPELYTRFSGFQANLEKLQKQIETVNATHKKQYFFPRWNEKAQAEQRENEILKDKVHQELFEIRETMSKDDFLRLASSQKRRIESIDLLDKLSKRLVVREQELDEQISSLVEKVHKMGYFLFDS